MLVPILSVRGAANWERDILYQPNLIQVNSTMYDFYNAHGVNQYNQPAEESGVAYIAAELFPGINGSTSLWTRYPESPGMCLLEKMLPCSHKHHSTKREPVRSRVPDTPGLSVGWEKRQHTMLRKCLTGLHVTDRLGLATLYPTIAVIKSGPPGSYDTKMASDPKVWFDEEQGVYVMFYFGLGDASDGHADIMIAFSTDLFTWQKDPEPLYKAGGHPMGIDKQYAHKISLIYHNGIGNYSTSSLMSF